MRLATPGQHGRGDAGRGTGTRGCGGARITSRGDYSVRYVLRIVGGEGDSSCPISRVTASFVFTKAFKAAKRIFELTKAFPAEEKYSMVDQMRRSSRAVCSNMAEAWRKRRNPAHFVSKLTDSAGEDETRVWLEFALASAYIDRPTFQELDFNYDLILGQLVKMQSEPEKWTVRAG